MYIGYPYIGIRILVAILVWGHPYIGGVSVYMGNPIQGYPCIGVSL